MKNRNFYIAILAILFGIVVWISVSLREQYVVTVDAPLLLTDIPEGFAVRSALPRVLRLKFRGDGWQLAGIVLGSKPHLVFSSAIFRGGKPITFNDVAERVTITPGVQLLDVKPESVRIELDRLAFKRVPVVLDAVVSFREGYGQVGLTVMTPDSIIIAGAESLLRTIDGWRTQRTMLENLRMPVDITVPLSMPEGYLIMLSDRTVNVSLTVEPFAEKTFNGIPVAIAGEPAAREVILLPPKMEIVARAGIKQLSSLSSADFHARVEYATILADSTGAVDVEVNAPMGVQIVTRKPDHVQYIIRERL